MSRCRNVAMGGGLMIDAAIIGLGWWGRRHVDAVRGAENWVWHPPQEDPAPPPGCLCVGSGGTAAPRSFGGAE